jgi:hypothetical protein
MAEISRVKRLTIQIVLIRRGHGIAVVTMPRHKQEHDKNYIPTIKRTQHYYAKMKFECTANARDCNKQI